MSQLKRYKSILIFLLAANLQLLSQSSSDALRLSEPGVLSNARALGMGNAYLAISNDYMATRFNPAGLGRIKSTWLSGGLYVSSLNNSTTLFNDSLDASSNATKFSNLSAVFALPTDRGSLVFALGYYKSKEFNNISNFSGFNPNNNSMIQDLTAYNSDITYNVGLSYGIFDNNDNWLYDTTHIQGRLLQSGETLAEGDINTWSFAGAVEVAKNVFVGGSVNFNTGTYKRDREYYEDDIQNYYTEPTDPNDEFTAGFKTFFVQDIIDWDVSGWDAEFGFLYDFVNFISLGATIKLPTKYTIKERFYVNAEAEYSNNFSYVAEPVDSRIEYNISTPYEISIGASVNLLIALVSAQIDYIDYTQMKFSGGLTPDVVGNNNKNIKDNFQPVLNYHLGGELTIPFTEIRVRAGVMYLPSPYEGDPSEFDKIYLNAGAGFVAGDSFAVDAVYSYGFWDTIGDNYGADLSRTYQKIDTHSVYLTTSFKF
jgi:hypothetical protein